MASEEQNNAPEENDEVDAIKLITVTIPEGKQPGDIFTYEEDGNELEIVVPEDHKPGDTMEILLNEDDDEDIETVSVFLGHDVGVTLNMITFIDEFEEIPEGEEAAEQEDNDNEEEEEEEDLEEDEDDGSNSMVWPTGAHMAQFLASPYAKVLLQDKKIALELGSGCGVAGMGLIAALAREEDPRTTKVTLTDLPSAISLLSANLKGNSKTLLIDSGLDANVAKLAWGKEEHIKDLGEEKFDLIVGSDLVYNPSEKTIQALSSTINTLLDPENGLVLLATRWRKPNEERVFFQEMEKLGYEFVLAEEQIKKMGGDSGSEENKEEDSSPKCDMSWQDFGNDKSDKSKKFFSETTFRVNGKAKPLGEITEEDLVGMDDQDFDDYELVHIQIYAGTKKN